MKAHGDLLLELDHVGKVFGGELLNQRRTVAVADFSLAVDVGRPTITAIAGESGSGKTTLANLVLDFAAPTWGEVRYKGTPLPRLDRRQRRDYRREVQAVFQDPYEVYNPFYKVDFVFDSVLKSFHLARDASEGRRLVQEAMEVVGLRPGEVLGKYPHQLSGGQRQRIMIARAFLLKPRLIVADEPVSMVDASLRAMILKIMVRLKQEFGISFLYITHDLSTAYQISDDIHVLYRGEVAERGPVTSVIGHPRHPYTQMLVGSIPSPDPKRKWEGRLELKLDDPGTTADQSVGCPFAGRCPHVMDICRREKPPSYPVEDGHVAACFLYQPERVIAASRASGGTVV